MLKQISCDKFLDNGQVRPPITFKPGLNAVVGDSAKSNSIGKSTLLMIIDFCFGGDDYISKETTTLEKVGHHTIFFTFEFNGIDHYYSRSTNEPKFVYEYTDSSNSEILKKVPYSTFKNELSKYYGLEDTGLTFRGAVGRFFRIYNRKTHNEMRPLNADVREDDKSGIEFLLKLYKLYGDLDDDTTSFEGISDKKKMYDNLRRYNAGFIAMTKDEYESNIAEIKTLENELVELQKQIKSGSSDTDLTNAEIKADIKKELNKLRRQRRFEENKLKQISFDNEWDDESLTSKFIALKEFFPEIDLSKITQYEQFHKDAKKYINREIKENMVDIADTIKILDDQIKNVEEQLADYKEIPDISEALLKRHHQISDRLSELKTANENYNKRSKAIEEFKQADAKLQTAVSSRTSRLQKLVNDKMDEINNSFENGQFYPPILQINNLKSYAFNTPNDTGTGSRFKGVAIFDLAILESTSLPVLVHDSIMFTNVEEPATATLLKLYEQQTNKQVFIAFDKFDNRGDEIYEILDRNKVLQLSDEPHALFGRQWNKKGD